MFLFREKDVSMVEPERALPGRDERIPVPARHEVLGTPLQPPFPEGHEQAVFGLGCFWGAERVFWQAPGVYTTAVGYAGGYTPNPTYQEICSGQTGHTEVGPRRLRPEADELRRAAAPLLGEPRPDAGHAPGQRHRHAVPLGDPLRERRAARGCRALTGHVPGRAARRGLRRDHDGDRAGRRLSTTPRTTTSSTSRRTRTATAASAERVSAAPSASFARRRAALQSAPATRGGAVR